jgi:hypothetical protein
MPGISGRPNRGSFRAREYVSSDVTPTFRRLETDLF